MIPCLYFSIHTSIVRCSFIPSQVSSIKIQYLKKGPKSALSRPNRVVRPWSVKLMTEMSEKCQNSFSYRWNSDEILKFLILYRWNTRPVSDRKPVNSKIWIYTGFIPVKIPGIYPAGSGANPDSNQHVNMLYEWQWFQKN